jgi:putative transcriptional regulator
MTTGPKPARASAPFGAAVRRLRTAAGLSREQLAVAAGVSHSTVVNLELGYYQPSLPCALALAAALGTTVDALANGEEAGS